MTITPEQMEQVNVVARAATQAVTSYARHDPKLEGYLAGGTMTDDRLIAALHELEMATASLQDSVRELGNARTAMRRLGRIADVSSPAWQAAELLYDGSRPLASALAARIATMILTQSIDAILPAIPHPD